MTVLEAPTGPRADLPPPAPPVAPEVPGWTIEWRGRRWHESDLTGKHLALYALLTGSDDYEALDINPLHGHQRLMQTITVLVAADDTIGVEDPGAAADVLTRTIDEVSGASADEILGALRFG